MLYLCICVFVFVYLCMRHLVISVLISLDQELSENVWFVWSKTSYSGDVTMRDVRTTTNDDKQGKIMLLSLWMLEGWVSQYICIYRVFCRLSRVAVEYRKYRVNKKYRSGVTVRDIQYVKYVKYIKYTSNIQNISNILYFFKSVLGVNSRSAVSCVTLSYVELPWVAKVTL